MLNPRDLGDCHVIPARTVSNLIKFDTVGSGRFPHRENELDTGRGAFCRELRTTCK